MEHQESKCSYVVGNMIALQLGAPYNQHVAAEITQVFEPFTLSSAMVVLLNSPALGLEGPVVLKLFDRRFAAQLRKDEHASPWASDIENKYHQFILDGGASEFIAKLNLNNKLVDEEGDTWDDVQTETYLHHQMHGLYKTEIEVYDILKDIQGKTIPQLFVSVTISSCPSSQGSNEYLDIPGILLQYINGFPLTDVAAHAPRETWQSLCEEAIQIVHLINDRGILNRDVKTRSFIVRQDPGKFALFMIDFAICKFRREYKDETEWRRWVSIQDEEGAVGYIMQKYLQGGFMYNRSDRATKLDDEFRRAE